MRAWIWAAGIGVMAGCAAPGPMAGKTYAIELTTSQWVSGYGGDLVPPLVEALRREGLSVTEAPDPDFLVNIRTEADVGQWVQQGGDQNWIYTVEVMVGLSPGAYVIPPDGTPAFGMRARLRTPDRDREDELACLIRLAARTAVARYQPEGQGVVDGQRCLRDARL